MLFLHTALQTGITDFEYQREYFKSAYTVILPDLRGHGKSVTNELSDFFSNSAEDIRDTLDHLGLQSVHIVGCSVGALVGLAFSKRYPQRVKTLTLSGILPEQPANWLELHKAEVARQSAIVQNEQVTAYFNFLHGEGWEQLLEIGENAGWYPFEETRDLTGLTMPVLYMVGEGNAAEVKGVMIYPEMIADLHVSVVPFASHLVHAEQAEVYSRLLEQFLERSK